jgi:hypothetical protein
LSLDGSDDGENVKPWGLAGIYGWQASAVFSGDANYLVGISQEQRIKSGYEAPQGEVVRQVSSKEQRYKGERCPRMRCDVRAHGIDIPC